MKDYNAYFNWTDSFLQEFSPNPNRFRFMTAMESIQTYDGPFKDEKTFFKFLDAFDWIFEEIEISDEQKSHLLYFSTLIEEYVWKINSKLERNKELNLKNAFWQDLLALPLRLTEHNGRIWFEVNSSDDSKKNIQHLYSRPSTLVDQNDRALRETAYYKNFYYDKTNGKKLMKPDRTQIEISRDVEITIKSTIKNGKKLIVPDSLLKEKIISAIVETMIAYNSNLKSGQLEPLDENKTKTDNLVIQYISPLILTYINKKNIIKPTKNGALSNRQGEFLFDYFAILGWINHKPGYKTLSTKMAPKEKNELKKQSLVLRRQYSISSKLSKKSTSNFLRSVLNCK